jgi:hypothetical protein
LGNDTTPITLSEVLPVIAPELAVTVLVPIADALTKPVLLTAMFEFDAIQLALLLRFCVLPSE